MISVYPIANDRRAKPDDKVTISLRIVFQRKKRHIPTVHKIPLKYWKDGEVTKGWEYYQQVNADLKSHAARVNQDLIDLNRAAPLTMDTLDLYLGGKTKNRIDVVSFTREFAKKQLALKKITSGTHRNYIKYADKLEQFAGGPVWFDQLNKDFLERYETWMIDRGNTAGTIWDTLGKFIKKISRAAKQPIDHDYEWPKPPKEGSKVYLTLKEVDMIEKCDKFSPHERQVADYFLLGCYSGLRFSDWTKFEIEKIHNHRALKVQAMKNIEPVYLTLSKRPRLAAIVARLAPASLNLQVVNRDLKLIGAKAGITKPLSTHVGRHTFAVLHAELGYSKEWVSQALGITLDTVEWYYKVTRQKLKNEEKQFGGL